jgi:hypothetical protein
MVGRDASFVCPKEFHGSQPSRFFARAIGQSRKEMPGDAPAGRRDSKRASQRSAFKFGEKSSGDALG